MSEQIYSCKFALMNTNGCEARGDQNLNSNSEIQKLRFKFRNKNSRINVFMNSVTQDFKVTSIEVFKYSKFPK